MIPVIDVFAGPGGLNEGFSSVHDGAGNTVFRTVASIEMEKSAVATLRLRSAIRSTKLESDGALSAVDAFAEKQIGLAELMNDPTFARNYVAATSEVHAFELSPSTRETSDSMIRTALGPYPEQPWVLIGGPPCQAYSLAGRSRRVHDASFEDDHKHFLYREYLHIIRQHRPTVFVMENVKGLLSSLNRGERIFDLIRDDLEQPADDLEYDLYSMVSDNTDLDAEDFIIKAERYGVPQRRHRLIIVGVLRGSGLKRPRILDRSDQQVSVSQALVGLPELRSSVSRANDPEGVLWREIWQTMSQIARSSGHELLGKPNLTVESAVPSAKPSNFVNGAQATYFDFIKARSTDSSPTWNHHSRGHRGDDLVRYGLLSALAAKTSANPKVRDLDKQFWPNHKNITDEVVPFQDRFRVQLAGTPATTIVSHIAKDGHYYIHPDPSQMRSFTVREAARLQSFPDNYIFLGNRTQQFTQVGNAVPPLLARNIGKRIAEILTE
ncbi:DNA cytosine methyltransferase [Glutamicibacter sp. BW78]|uniref:DNA cytosine methyltransferase n=1 Tax=Glutamicibacter sp. BW78 TaxID=2024403 RepID=UPI0013040606|nr:DNA cytosine methyltransferase [Glutamicibacter sp. BW78]